MSADAEQQHVPEVMSRSLSGRKGTRLVLRRDADGLTTGMVVRSVGATWRVQGRIARTGDVVLEPEFSVW